MKNGTDQGFEIFYWKLSYRRKFVRTLWVGAAILLLYFLSPTYVVVQMPRDAIFGIFLVLFLAQAGYTYTKWKKEVQKQAG